MKRASRMLVSLSILVAILLTALPLTFAYDVIEREIIEYEYTLRQTSTTDNLEYTNTAERMSNAGRIVPAINRVTATNASHNIYFTILSPDRGENWTNVYWHRTGRYEYEWIIDISPGAECCLGMRRNTSDRNREVTVEGSWSPDQNDIIIPRRQFLNMSWSVCLAAGCHPRWHPVYLQNKS